MHNLTYTERARIAYANGNTELADALEQCADYEAEVEQLTERIWDLEQENSELMQTMRDLISEVEQLVESEWSTPEAADEFVPSIMQARNLIKQSEGLI